jgi:hypothetical protein
MVDEKSDYDTSGLFYGSDLWPDNKKPGGYPGFLLLIDDLFVIFNLVEGILITHRNNFIIVFDRSI